MNKPTNINRRNFLKQSSFTSGGLLLSGCSTATLAPLVTHTTNALDLTIFATNWGWHGTMDAFCKKAKEEGYDGVEIWTPRNEKDTDIFMNAVAKHDLKFGFLAGNWGETVQANLEVFESMLATAIALKPIFINCHSGKDHYSFADNQKFIEATEQRKSEGIPIYHEGHRSRMLFAAHITKTFLEKNPNLRLTLDISHWCVVAESLLQDQTENVALALSRTDHIHSRVGFEEGPQVCEPRAPEFKKAVDAHFAWWDQVVEMKKQSGQPLTMTTEFGPPNYMWSLPYTKQPLANLWEVNAHMMHLWRERYLNT